MTENTAPEKHHLAIKLRKFNRVCPITGYKEESIKIGAPVIVQTDRGVEAGEIVGFQRGLPHGISHEVKLKKVIRYATQQDLEKVRGLDELEAKAVAIAAQKAQEHELPIKMVMAEYLFDTSHATLYFKAKDGETIKNLRDLTRDLSTSLEARVTLKQISPRDEARMSGGLGPCGRQLCCSTWLEKPKHVTVKMVKNQGLAISPTKTSGVCGRLMCCLEYEYDKDK